MVGEKRKTQILVNLPVTKVPRGTRNKVRKVRVSRAHQIKMGVLLGRSPADKEALVTWVFGVVPSGFSLRGPD